MAKAPESLSHSVQGWVMPYGPRPMGPAPLFEPWWSMGVHPPSWMLGPRSPWWQEGLWEMSFNVGCTPLIIAQLACKHGTYVDSENKCKCSAGLNQICVKSDQDTRRCAANLECSSKTGRCVPVAEEKKKKKE
ncbi:uncharacterized protein [Penaeus vannamei]|uniref:uncharacterized protein n=1 Tax=Penaeus vannamei TaxID=6689 RepID=UPI00387F8ECB